ncbi:hypothetical protein [Kordiimonas sp.]|uniref:hypothetical protein n=1 Tax=Kordiimonas sp. TaxID=1970157 RepID=UPI003A8D60CF
MKAFLGGIVLGAVFPAVLLTGAGFTITDKNLIAEYDKSYYKQITQTTVETAALIQGNSRYWSESTPFSTIYMLTPLTELRAEDVERVCIVSASVGQYDVENMVLDIFLKEKDQIYKSLDEQDIFRTDTPAYGMLEFAEKQIGGTYKIVSPEDSQADTASMRMNITEYDFYNFLPVLASINPANEIAGCRDDGDISTAVIDNNKVLLAKQPAP